VRRRGLCWAAQLLWLALPGLAAAAAPVPDLPPGQMTFRVFGGADGLHNQAVQSLAQDGDGELWIATDNGLDRFDGATFTHFSRRDGLLSGEFTVLGAAPDGAMCAGNDSGLVCWDGARFSRTGARGMPERPVASMASAAGVLWVGTKDRGLYVRAAGGDFVAAPGWPGSPATPVTALWADADGLVAGNGATVELTAGDGAWHDIGDVGLDAEPVEGVLRDHAGALWIRTASHLWWLPNGGTRASDLREGLPRSFESYRAPATMAIGARGDVLFATDDGIAYRADGRWHTIDASVGMPRGGVRTLFVDREGTLWLGGAGLYQLRGRGIVESYDAASGVPGETAWTYAYDRQDRLMMGTNRCLARADAGRWSCMAGTEHRYVTSVVLPPQGGMFVGGEPSDLLYVDDLGRVTSLGGADVPARPILGLTLGPEGDLWIGKWHGLYRLRGAVPGPIERVDVPGAPADTRIASLVVVGDQLWITAAPGGVFVRDHGTWHQFSTAQGLRSALPYHLIARSDGRLCTTYNEPVGVTCFRYDGHAIHELEHLGTAEGLTSDTVYFLGEDRERRLWIGTGDGVDVVTPSGIDHLDTTDGLVGDDSAGKAFFLDRDGSVWLGATGGATHVFAQHYRGPPPVPQISFLHGALGDRALPHAASAATVLEVPHDRSALILELGAGSLMDPKRIEYEVRLSPQEVAWSTTHQRDLRYPALLPSAYRLEARARIDAGAWGPMRELRFVVLPAWWQTGWFIALAVGAGLVVIGAGTSWRQRTALQRRTRQLNEQADAGLRTVIDLMPELISVYRDGPSTYLNVGSRQLLGIVRPDGRFALTELVERVHADDLPRITEQLRTLSDAAPHWASDILELRLRDANGSWRVCEVSAARVEIGGARAVIASGRDVTERNRLRAKLLLSDRMASLGTLAAGIAHEINNPLSYVSGNLEVIAETIAEVRGPPTVEMLGEIDAAVADARDGAERVRKIVLGLRAFTRSEHAKLVPLELAGVLEVAIRMTSNEVRHRAQLVCEFAPTPVVLGDDGRLTQVFINLLTNAAHSIPEGRSDRNRITLRTYTSDRGHAVIEVEDTGSGMTPDVQARVFDPFFTTKEVGAGTGLGLAICHGIIDALGGQISIESPPQRAVGATGGAAGGPVVGAAGAAGGSVGAAGGAVVGSAVGAAGGPGVGAAVSPAAGAAVGPAVGAAVGPGVGAAGGPAVGAAVSPAVGAVVGATVGPAVGAAGAAGGAVGAAVGPVGGAAGAAGGAIGAAGGAVGVAGGAVGAAVSPAVGAAVSPAVGVAVSPAVGAAVSPAVGVAVSPAAGAMVGQTGSGTLVRVVLPTRVARNEGAPVVAAAPAPVAAAAPGGLPRLRVMLIDDEPLVAETIARLLRQDHDVTVATRGEDAISLITTGARFDAIVSDVMMPTMTGIELSEELQRLAPEQAQRLIFLSGGAFTEHARARLEQIGVPQLAKPVTAAALRDCVREVAGKFAAGRAVAHGG